VCMPFVRVLQLRAVCTMSRAGAGGLGGNGSTATTTKPVLDVPVKWDSSLAPNAGGNAALFRAPAAANMSMVNTRLRLFSGTSNPVGCPSALTLLCRSEGAQLSSTARSRSPQTACALTL
jgi:hypothetical protein